MIVNAGLGKGAPIGTGRFEANRQTITTNLVSGLAQCEAAMEHFRAAGRGHLVVVSSMSAIRGLPKAQTAYAASKAGIAALAEGLRVETLGTDIVVTTLLPGYIRSEMNDRMPQKTPLMVGHAGRGARHGARRRPRGRRRAGAGVALAAAGRGAAARAAVGFAPLRLNRPRSAVTTLTAWSGELVRQPVTAREPLLHKGL